jgi:hypothetical protein
VRQMYFVLAAVLLAGPVLTAQTPPKEPAASSVPVAVPFQADCSGFIAAKAVPRDLVVTGGEDDTFHSDIRQYVEGDTVFISQHNGGALTPGAVYNVIRPARELFLTMQYPGERGDLRKLGKPYENVGRVKVLPRNADRAGNVESVSGNASLTRPNAKGIVAEVTFSCGAIERGDILVPFQPTAIPDYTLSKPLDPFAPLDSSKQQGRITASRNNYDYVGAQTVVYLNLGAKDGTKPGQRFRIYKQLPPHSTGYLTIAPVPPEVVGEAVVLSVRTTSCTAMVVSSYREISAGDYVEAE